MDASIKKMKQAFAELQSCLMDREVALLVEMDKVKAEAMEILLSRQKKAEVLKKMTDVAVRMSEEQLVELRADIKHFVSERKYDEDLGRVARFTCDVETLKQMAQVMGPLPPLLLVPLFPAFQVLTREAVPRPRQTPVTGPAPLTIGRYFQATGEEDKATGHKAKRPLTPQTKGAMTLVVFIRLSEYSTSGPRKRASGWSQAYSSGINEIGASMAPSPPKPSFKRGLPQRKPRTSQAEAVSS
ncbi:spermatogenesis-associated serine-rich protein 2 [Sigmodon hispidus]